MIPEGAAAAGKPDLLSGAPSVQDDEAGQIYGGLAAYHHLPADTDLPGGGIQVYPFQGSQKMPKEYAYTIDELLHVDGNDENKKLYYNEIIHSIIDTSIADKFIAALCRLIQNLTIDNLHIIGDIFDRGPRADIIMQELMSFHDVDIQWGNHDISWMGLLRAIWPVSAMYCGSL